MWYCEKIYGKQRGRLTEVLPTHRSSPIPSVSSKSSAAGLTETIAPAVRISTNMTDDRVQLAMDESVVSNQALFYSKNGELVQVTVWFVVKYVKC